MTKPVSSIADVIAALPAARRAVRNEIQARIGAGEQIGSIDNSEMRRRSKAVIERAETDQALKKSAA